MSRMLLPASGAPGMSTTATQEGEPSVARRVSPAAAALARAQARTAPAVMNLRRVRRFRLRASDIASTPRCSGNRDGVLRQARRRGSNSSATTDLPDVLATWRYPASIGFANCQENRHRAQGRRALQIPEPVFLPARTHAGLVLRGRPHGRRKALVVPLRPLRHLPRARGVDEHAVPEPGAELGDVTVLERRRGIDRRAEAAREDDDAAFAGIHAMGEGPVDLLVRRRVDILFDHDDVLVAVLRGAGAPERRRDLLGLALVVLGDLHVDVHAVGDGRHPDVANAGDAGAVEDVPGDGRPLRRGHHAVLAVGAGQRAFEAALEDGIVAMRDAGDLHRRARRRHVRDVAGELAERAFHFPRGRVVVDQALDDDLGRRWHVEVHRLATHELGRLPTIGAHHVPLADSGQDRRYGEERNDGVPADDAGHGHGLATLGVLDEVVTPVLAALHEQHRRRVLLADHAAVDPGVHHARVGVAGPDRRERVNVAPALFEVPLRDRELGLIDAIAPLDVLLHRAGANDDGRNLLAILLHHVLHELAVRHVLGKAEREREAPAVTENAGDELRAAAGLVALDLLEEQRRALLLQHAARDGADLAIPVHLGRDPAQLALLVEPAEPLTQVHEGHRRSPLFNRARAPGLAHIHTKGGYAPLGLPRRPAAIVAGLIH